MSVTAAAVGKHGTFTPTINNVSSGDGAGQVTWNFTVNNADLQFLAQGQSVVQTYTVEVDDNHADSGIQTDMVTGVQTCALPIFTAAVASGSVTEDAHVAATESASGTI